MTKRANASGRPKGAFRFTAEDFREVCNCDAKLSNLFSHKNEVFRKCVAIVSANRANALLEEAEVLEAKASAESVVSLPPQEVKSEGASEKLEELERLARSATPGPWVEWQENVVHDYNWDGSQSVTICSCPRISSKLDDRKHDRAFITAANPQTVLDLIGEIRRLRADQDEYAENMAKRKIEVDKIKGVTDMVTQIESLRAENTSLREALELIAAPKRADGTYNRCREACEQIARAALSKHT